MPKPFPHCMQVGVDICHTPRISRLLSSSPLKSLQRGSENGISSTQGGATPTQTRERFLNRLFNRYEVAHYQMARLGPYDDNLTGPPLRLREHYFIAGRYAAKEAIIKAVRHRNLSFHDIVVLPHPVRLPSLEEDSLLLKGQPFAGSPRAVVLAKRRKPVRFDKFPTRTTHPLRPETKFGVSLEEYEEDMRRWEEGEEVQLNISHDGEYAIAVCLAACPVSL
ncbi:putative holo-acyl-carrier-protein synthase [Golovinomyces cichoracearum]|uniref:Putative holo-acyl-carrier-protein synthase n=1 Tax=Golovinomyces cichoracearum TaxID=62708 RepID=A0A420IW67_9PEZI|nr:putative holo-acyl-carrier-protein synthase [Golovinomyces cichoracearum]